MTGEQLTIADLQYFFEITNYTVYERSFSHFKLISQWFARMLEVPEVKEIHQQWQQVAPEVIKTLKSVPVIENAKL